MKIVYTPNQTKETCLQKKGRVVFITFPALDQFSGRIAHGFSTRKGGVSKGPYKSMNLGLDTGDQRENILFNYMEFTKALGIRYKNLVIPVQKHTTEIRIVSGEDRGQGMTREQNEEPADGLMTNEPGLGLCIRTADCVPVYLYDPENEAIALLHSGWRGTAGQISEKAVGMMQKEYGTDPGKLIACIGPSVCKDCYEVSEDLYSAFSEAYSEREMQDIFSEGKDASHFQLDLWKAISVTLQRAGVASENLHVTDLCTCHNPELLFSYRFQRERRGLNAAVLMLLPEPVEKAKLFKNFLPTIRS